MAAGYFGLLELTGVWLSAPPVVVAVYENIDYRLASEGRVWRLPSEGLEALVSDVALSFRVAEDEEETL